MHMEKTKGFTLIELIATIIVVTVIAIISVPIITNIIGNLRNEAWKKQVTTIKEAAVLYLSRRSIDKPEYPVYNDEYGDYIYLTNLYNVDLIEEKMVDPRTRDNVPDNLRIDIVNNGEEIYIDDPRTKPTLTVDPLFDEHLYGLTYDIYKGVILTDPLGEILNNNLLTVTCTYEGVESDCESIGSELGAHTITYKYNKTKLTRDVDVIYEVLNEPEISITPTTATGGPVTVTIDYQESQQAKNYYKIDTGSWIEYTEPFQVSNNCMLYAKIEIVGQSYKTSQYRVSNIVPTGWTAIITPQDLNNMRNNLAGKYILMNNIALSGSWNPIMDFAGSLDGNGFKITGLYVNNTGLNNV
ncbi:MAG: prepilin-type N-terminal cleavage/methylation domain-containing protein, partial [Ignavibacteriales bacterium]